MNNVSAFYRKQSDIVNEIHNILMFQMKDLHEIIISRKTTVPAEERGKIKKLSTDKLELFLDRNHNSSSKKVLYLLYFHHLSCDSSVGKESTCNAGDHGSIPGLGRSPLEGIGYALQYSWASLVAQLVKNPLAM